MIVDSLKNCVLYESIHDDFAKVFEVLRGIAAGDIKEKTVLNEGQVWVNPPTVANAIDVPRVFEAHREFIDIHFVVKGAETFGYANVERLKTTKEYDVVDDYELLDGNQEFITLESGDFCIVFPQDAHIPTYQKIGDDDLIRVVAKIRCKKYKGD